jgi:hypothetical protein
LTLPPGRTAELSFDPAQIEFLQEDRRDEADIRGQKASTMRQLIEAGFVPDTVTQYVATGDESVLEHTGNVSVQLQPAGTTDADGNPLRTNEQMEQARDLAEVIQKIYLGVGKVITSDEARVIINQAGGSLSIPNADVPFALPTTPVSGGDV